MSNNTQSAAVRAAAKCREVYEKHIGVDETGELVWIDSDGEEEAVTVINEEFAAEHEQGQQRERIYREALERIAAGGLTMFVADEALRAADAVADPEAKESE